MQFSKFIPVSVKEQELSHKLISVFDGLQAYKEEIIYGSLRTTNFALIDNKKWLLKKLADYGFSGLPYEMPLLVLQQLLLNAIKLNKLRGSYDGVRLFVSIITMGEVTIDTDGWLKDSAQLIPDSTTQGYVTEDNVNPYFYVVDDTDILSQSNTLTIHVKTPYFGTDYVIAEYDDVVSTYDESKAGFSDGGSTMVWNIPEIEEYLIGTADKEGVINEFVSFYSKAQITWDVQHRDSPYYDKLLNPYFRNE